MTLTLSLGWWIVPTLVTLVGAGWLAFTNIRYRPTQADYAFGGAFVDLLGDALVVIGILSVWLAWALLR